MKRLFAACLALLALASPAAASNDPFLSGPLADFLDIFRQEAIPRREIAWSNPYAPGTVGVSTS
ncbi:hypothetical protein WDZ92_41235, partial [Nostoc sp. NIES-2111]